MTVEHGILGTSEEWEQATRDSEWRRAEERKREAEAA